MPRRAIGTISGMRRAYSDAIAVANQLPEGVLDFDLVTPHRDTYKTRFDPMGAMFHSAARPWMDTHDTSTVKNVFGEMTEVVEQSPERFRVRVRFDMQKPDAAEAYRQHKEGFVKGCSIGFDPVPGATHLEIPDGGERCERCAGRGAVEGSDCVSCFGTGSADALLVYDKYYVLEGSSCAAPSNPMALCVRTIEDARAAKKPPTKVQTLIFSKDTFKTAESAKRWAKDHDYSAAKVDETEDSFRLRQEDPSDFKEGSFKTITLTDGVKAVVGHEKERSVSQASAAHNHPQQHDTETSQRAAAPIAGNFAFTSGVFPMLKPEHRGMYRYMVGDHLRMAGDHLDAMAGTDHPELRKFHRDAAQASMNRAGHMVRMISDSMAEGHEDAPADAQMIGSMMRAAPEGLGDAELAAEWQACQRSALPHAAQTWAGVGKKLAKDPSELRTRFAAMQTVEAAHKRLIGEQRAAAAKTEDSERMKLVLELAGSEVGLEPALEAEMLGCDPVGYVRNGANNTRSGQPWTLEAIRTFKLQVQGAVAQVTRTAPLKAVDANGSNIRTAPETTMQPASPDRNAQLAAPLGAFIDELSKRMGADPAKVRAVAHKGAAPGQAFVENSMTKRISEIHANRKGA